MLWIEKYRPRDFSQILGQENVVARLNSFAEAGTIPHLQFTGPHGTGKSICMECLASALFKDSIDENLTIIQAADLFALGKKYLENKERYAHIYRKDQSLLTNFKNITRWHASIRPLDAEFRLIVFEGASSLTREAQAALRRIMERYSRTCRFILISTHPSGIIPAIRSRCLPFFFSSLDEEIIRANIQTVLNSEKLSVTDIPTDEIDLIVQAADGDLRKALVLLQSRVESGKSFDLLRCSRTEVSQVAHAVFTAMVAGDMDTAIRRIEILMIEYGLSPDEVLQEIRTAAKREYNDPRIAESIGNADYVIRHCNNEYIQLNALVSRIVTEVFHECFTKESPPAL
ncbi:MAG TPA: AAA family ATPase [Methanoregulaceae archaeon]|nr:AAA family ATPase [Methanoregulaceae archaeon]